MSFLLSYSEGRAPKLTLAFFPSPSGRCGNSCQIDNAAGTKCVGGTCYPTWCNPGSQLSSDGLRCTPITASQKARAWKKNTIVTPKSLCPDQETACPIAGSA